jgi:hypothetical protein
MPQPGAGSGTPHTARWALRVGLRPVLQPKSHEHARVSLRRKDTCVPVCEGGGFDVPHDSPAGVL